MSTLHFFGSNTGTSYQRSLARRSSISKLVDTNLVLSEYVPSTFRKMSFNSLSRANSFSNMCWIGEQGPTTIAQITLNRHRENPDLSDQDAESAAAPTEYDPLLTPYGHDGRGRLIYFPKNGDGSFYTREVRKGIRCQVVVWSIGQPDVLQGKVQMKFRITTFWNDVKYTNQNGDMDSNQNSRDSGRPFQQPVVTARKKSTYWVMQGRDMAYEKPRSDKGMRSIDIPPIAILNADSFEIVGQPEVSVLNERTGLIRWTSMYRASLLQEKIRVDEFPHDIHELKLKIGILVDRQNGGRWDRRVFPLAMATNADARGSTRRPEGLLVTHVKIPGFSFVQKKVENTNESETLNISIEPLDMGHTTDTDTSLMVSVKVSRDSGYYDRNIIPLLVLLNLVAACLLLLDPDKLFQRGLLLLNVSFLEINLRMIVDRNLPSVGYQIKMQKTVNRFLYSTLSLVFESALVYVLVKEFEWSFSNALKIDLLAAVCTLFNIGKISFDYYSRA